MEGIRRFDNRVANYERFRPGYPDAVAGLLAEHGVRAPATIADIGAGTGKLAQVFVRAGYRVLLIEPNAAMRAVAERNFAGGNGAPGVRDPSRPQEPREVGESGSPRIEVRAGTAEATGLDDGSVDAIVAGQAFHWFEPRATRAEWLRILKPGGAVVLVWNDRRNRGSLLLQDYEELLLRHCPDYSALQRTAPDEAAVLAFLGGTGRVRTFDSEQRLDWEGLLGRVLSASYVPLSGPAHDALVAGLRASFERHAVNGRVTLPYDTRVFHGPLR